MVCQWLAGSCDQTCYHKTLKRPVLGQFWARELEAWLQLVRRVFWLVSGVVTTGEAKRGRLGPVQELH